MGEEYIVIQQGTPSVATEEIVFLGIGSAGTPGACRRMTFPNALLAPIVYSAGGRCMNPRRTWNLDNDVLVRPSGRVVKTQGSTRVIRFDESTEDVIVTEIWPGNDNLAPMPTSLFRQFYEYWLNQPAFSQSQTQYIQWEPRDRNANTYNVEIVTITTAGSEGALDVRDVRDPGGLFGGGDYDNGTDFLNATATGLMDREIRIVLRIVSVVV